MFWQTSGKTRVSSRVSTRSFTEKKEKKPKPDTGRCLQPIFSGAGKGKELLQSQTLRLTTGLSSNITVEFTLPTSLLPLQMLHLVLAFLCCLKTPTLLGCEQRVSLLYVSCYKKSRCLALTHLGDDQSCLPEHTGDILLKGE